jgi:hypothetical protein
MTKRMPANRGRIETVSLSKPITLNRTKIISAVIEIDHINYGLKKDGTGLNSKARSNFTIRDIEKFLKLLDGEELAAVEHKGKTSRFSIRIDSPIRGKFFGRTFIMIFDINYDKDNELHTITLFPGW